MTCAKHRFYKAIRPPKIMCRACWVDYLTAHPEMVNKFAIAIRKLNIQPSEYNGPAPQEEMKAEAIRKDPAARVNMPGTIGLARSQVKKLAAAGINGNKAKPTKAVPVIAKEPTPEGMDTLEFVNGRWVNVDPKKKYTDVSRKAAELELAKDEAEEEVVIEQRPGGMVVTSSETVVSPGDPGVIDITPRDIPPTEEEEPTKKKKVRKPRKTKVKKEE